MVAVTTYNNCFGYMYCNANATNDDDDGGNYCSFEDYSVICKAMMDIQME